MGRLLNARVPAICTAGATPVPERVTVCFVPGVPVTFPLSVMFTVAPRKLVVVGLNDTLNVQELCPETFPPVRGQGLLAPAASVKSPGFPFTSSTMAVIASAASPLLLIVTTVAALVVPTRWFPTSTFVVDSVAVGGACPVPVRFAVCTLPATSFELSVNFRTAGPLAPAAPGVNVIATVQVLLGAAEPIVAPATQVVPAPGTIAKSAAFVLAGSIKTVASFRLSVPAFVSVIVC